MSLLGWNYEVNVNFSFLFSFHSALLRAEGAGRRLREQSLYLPKAGGPWDCPLATFLLHSPPFLLAPFEPGCPGLWAPSPSSLADTHLFIEVPSPPHWGGTDSWPVLGGLWKKHGLLESDRPGSPLLYLPPSWLRSSALGPRDQGTLHDTRLIMTTILGSCQY